MQPLSSEVFLPNREALWCPSRALGRRRFNSVAQAKACLMFIGFVGVVIICVLPMWKVSAFIGSNIVTA
ncbi:Claudin-like protein ZF-A89 [Liparis tanakae]|uniref:Claudin-like protein ZF-A89 n=1 Tax=Liparis tanakae TaxID=230148 RepID=A0A4Z2G455_9TELE|nr:Claudin-like protein ZF-A89 [Liparis tanakae]